MARRQWVKVNAAGMITQTLEHDGAADVTPLQQAGMVEVTGDARYVGLIAGMADPANVAAVAARTASKTAKDGQWL